jgi:FKBP-type peptidyl-prolyl cis-trans isomerase (trigger factor)
VNSFLDAAARQYGESLSLGGYRPGNAPLALVEKYFAKKVAALARQNMLDSVMDSLMREHTLYPVNKVAHDDCPLVRGQDLFVQFVY